MMVQAWPQDIIHDARCVTKEDDFEEAGQAKECLKTVASRNLLCGAFKKALRNLSRGQFHSLNFFPPLHLASWKPDDQTCL